jgi:hypothetical protein
MGNFTEGRSSCRCTEGYINLFDHALKLRVFPCCVLPYILRVINASYATEKSRWRRFLTLRFHGMHNHVAFAAQQGSPAVSYQLQLMNTEGLIDEENMPVSPLRKEWFDNLQLDEIRLIPAEPPPAPAPVSLLILLLLTPLVSCSRCCSKQKS